ncbi:hypothetical protein, partial [Mycobacterium lehmannii]
GRLFLRHTCILVSKVRSLQHFQGDSMCRCGRTRPRWTLPLGCALLRHHCGMRVMPLHDSRARAERAFQLRSIGWSWNRIATELGYASHGAAQTAVKRHQERNGPEAADSSRQSLIESARITAAVLFDRFAAASHREDDKTLALLNGEIARNRDQLAKLTGAYMPAQVNVTTADDVKRLRDEFYELRGLPTAAGPQLT